MKDEKDKVVIEITVRPSTPKEQDFTRRLMEMEENMANGMSFEEAIKIFDEG